MVLMTLTTTILTAMHRILIMSFIEASPMIDLLMSEKGISIPLTMSDCIRYVAFMHTLAGIYFNR